MNENQESKTTFPEVEEKDIAPAEMELISDRDLMKEVQKIEKNIEAFKKIMGLALKLTNPEDWIIQRSSGGALSPYLQDRGTERIAIAFGVDVSGLALSIEWMEDDKGRYYTFIATGKAFSKKLGRYVEDVGVCSSRDKFFAKIGDEWREIEEVDAANIRKKAITNLYGRLTKRLLGLIGVSMDDLRTAGFNVERMQKIEYPAGQQKAEKLLSPEALEKRKEIERIAMYLALGNAESKKFFIKESSKFVVKGGKDAGKEVFVESADRLTSESWINQTLHRIKANLRSSYPVEYRALYPDEKEAAKK